MHFEILIEDESGKRALELLLPKIISEPHTSRVLSYKGIGRLPKNLKAKSDANKRILLDQLPRLLQGYGKTYHGTGIATTVIVICDLDDRCLKAFRQELSAVLATCQPQPVTRFCIAVEEGEAWLLGDSIAITRAYPRAKVSALRRYQQDSICGTWELLADAIYPGGASKLTGKAWHVIGVEKSNWAEKICPHMDVTLNASPSFNYFCRKVQEQIPADAD